MSEISPESDLLHQRTQSLLMASSMLMVDTGAVGGITTTTTGGSACAMPQMKINVEDLLRENNALHSKIKDLTMERDRLLCEVSNLRLELDMSELKRLPLDCLDGFEGNRGDQNNRSNKMNAAKLKKIEGQVRIGGKGSARRKRKHVQRTSTYDEKRLQTTLQKLSLTPVAGVNSVTLTMNNGKEVMMSSPKVQGSVMANMFVFSGDMFDVIVPDEKQHNDDVDDNDNNNDKNNDNNNDNNDSDNDNDNDSDNDNDNVNDNGNDNEDDDDDDDDDDYENDSFLHDETPLLISIDRKPSIENKDEQMPSMQVKDLIPKDILEHHVRNENYAKKSSSPSMENIEEHLKKSAVKKSSDQQLVKNKKKKKPKKPRNRIRSRNKIMTDAKDNFNFNSILHIKLDGAGDGQNVMQLKDLSHGLANLDDTTDANSNPDSDKTSIFSDSSDLEQTVIGDNDSFMTLCPEDFNFTSEDEAENSEEQAADDENDITLKIDDPVKSSPDEDKIVINEIN